MANWIRLDRHHFHGEMPLTAERIGNRTAAFRLLQQPLRPFDIGAGGDMQFGVRLEAREPHPAIDAVQGTLSARLEALPGEFRRGRYCAEVQYEAIRH